MSMAVPVLRGEYIGMSCVRGVYVYIGIDVCRIPYNYRYPRYICIQLSRACTRARARTNTHTHTHTHTHTRTPYHKRAHTHTHTHTKTHTHTQSTTRRPEAAKPPHVTGSRCPLNTCKHVPTNSWAPVRAEEWEISHIIVHPSSPPASIT